MEVYPAAAFALWGFNAVGYKRRTGAQARLRLLQAIEDATKEWLDLPPDVRALCQRSDDALDALIAAMVARAAAIGLVRADPARAPGGSDARGVDRCAVSEQLGQVAPTGVTVWVGPIPRRILVFRRPGIPYARPSGAHHSVLPACALFPDWCRAVGFQTRLEHRFHGRQDCVLCGALAQDSPRNHGPPDGGVQREGKALGVAGSQLARLHRVVQHLLKCAQGGPRLRVSEPMELWIGQINLQKRQSVRNRFGSRRHVAVATHNLAERIQRIRVRVPDRGELPVGSFGAEGRELEQQRALRPETLYECRSRHARFLPDVREREVRPELRHHPLGRGDQVFVRSASGSRAHRADCKRSYSKCLT